MIHVKQINIYKTLTDTKTKESVAWISIKIISANNKSNVLPSNEEYNNVNNFLLNWAFLKSNIFVKART